MILSGCDTETYYQDEKGFIEKGLKSIQLVTESEELYFIASDYTKSDDDIRCEINKKFLDYILDYKEELRIAFFNMTFDVSQFLKYMVSQAGLTVSHDQKYKLKKNEILFLETDRKLYSITIRNRNGKLIKMLDLANFCQGVKLDDACKSWINEQKVQLDNKVFSKQMPTLTEKDYAMQDARLTLKLFKKFLDESVIENRTYTIAGRTIRHFKDFCKSEYNTSLEKLLFLSEDKDFIQEQKDLFEKELRCGVRGGICQAWQKGIFEHVTHIDARSMYPTQCVRNLYPCGELLKEPPKIGRYTEILYPIGWFKLKKGKIPCMQWTSKGNCEQYSYLKVYECGEYVKDFFLDGTFPIWKEEYEIITAQYHVFNEEIKKRWYIRMNDNVVLKDYVNRLYDGKKNNTGAKRLYYKYLLNALYGKFLSRPDGISIDYIQDGNDEWHRVKVESEKSTYYLPLGNIKYSLSFSSFRYILYRIVDSNDGQSNPYESDNIP